jgi:hypothetical protein
MQIRNINTIQTIMLQGIVWKKIRHGLNITVNPFVDKMVGFVKLISGNSDM